MKNKVNRKLTWCLFVFYMIALIWIILLKMQFSFKDLDHVRRVNLIPFAGSVVINGKLDFGEIIANIIIFIPFGIYVCMLKSEWSFVKKNNSNSWYKLAF